MQEALNLRVREDDLTSADVQQLIAEHLQGMQGNSPPGHVNALAINALRTPNITFWTAWLEGALCGCGALKQLRPDAGEVKSMRTRPQYLRRGVAQRVLDTMTDEAQRRGYRALYLETGTGEAFEAAHGFYLRNGFTWCASFGEYTATDFNVFMVKHL
ncbi:MAG: GNAT family N-acetyltransferase [Pseudomonadota bacterium]